VLELPLLEADPGGVRRKQPAAVQLHQSLVPQGVERHVRQYTHPHLQLDIGLDDVRILGRQQDLRRYAGLGKRLVYPHPPGEAGLIGDDGPVGQGSQGQIGTTML